MEGFSLNQLLERKHQSPEKNAGHPSPPLEPSGGGLHSCRATTLDHSSLPSGDQNSFRGSL